MRAVVVLLLSLAIQGPPRTGVIEGFVIRAKTNPPAPLVNARVELNGDPDLVVRTDSSGKFVFSGLPPSRYRVRVTKDGYLRQEYPATAPGIPGLPIVLAADQRVEGIGFRLDPAPTLSGVIRDANNSRVANVVVDALRKGFDARGNRTLTLTASAKTDDTGVYRLYWLDPGEYLVVATPPPPPQANARSLAKTYFPGFLSVDDAKAIRTESGRDSHGADFALREAWLVSVEGSIRSASTGTFAAASVLLYAAEDAAGVARFQTKSHPPPVMGRNNYAISGVPAGSYFLWAQAGNEKGAQRIVVQSADLVRTDLTLSQGVDIRGRFGGVDPRTVDLRQIRVTLSEVTALPLDGEAAVKADGSFVVNAMQPGDYSVNVTGLPGDLYVRSASLSGSSVLEKLAIYSSPPLDDLQILIGTDGSQVTGVVFDQQDAPFTGAQVTLIPAGVAPLRLDLYQTATTGPGGAFTFRGVMPGDYKVFGWNNLEPNAQRNAEYMRNFQDRGTILRIGPSERATMSLRLIQVEL